MKCIGGLAALVLKFTALIAHAEVLMEGKISLLSAVDHAQALTHRHMRVESADPHKVSDPTAEKGAHAEAGKKGDVDAKAASAAANTASDEPYLFLKTIFL